MNEKPPEKLPLALVVIFLLVMLWAVAASLWPRAQ